MSLKDPAKMLSVGIVSPTIGASAMAAVGYPYIGFVFLVVFSAYPLYHGLLRYIPSWPLLSKMAIFSAPLVFFASFLIGHVFDNLKIALLLIIIFCLLGVVGFYQAKIQQGRNL